MTCQCCGLVRRWLASRAVAICLCVCVRVWVCVAVLVSAATSLLAGSSLRPLLLLLLLAPVAVVSCDWLMCYRLCYQPVHHHHHHQLSPATQHRHTSHRYIQTTCAACSVAATICPRPLQMVWWLLQPPRAFNSEVIIHCWAITSLKNTQAVWRQNSPLFRRAYDLSTPKWHHGSPVSWDSFTPIFSLQRLSILDLESHNGTDRQTDRQTDGRTTAINA